MHRMNVCEIKTEAFIHLHVCLAAERAVIKTDTIHSCPQSRVQGTRNKLTMTKGQVSPPGKDQWDRRGTTQWSLFLWMVFSVWTLPWGLSFLIDSIFNTHFYFSAVPLLLCLLIYSFTFFMMQVTLCGNERLWLLHGMTINQDWNIRG